MLHEIPGICSESSTKRQLSVRDSPVSPAWRCAVTSCCQHILVQTKMHLGNAASSYCHNEMTFYRFEVVTLMLWNNFSLKTQASIPFCEQFLWAESQSSLCSTILDLKKKKKKFNHHSEVCLLSVFVSPRPRTFKILKNSWLARGVT